MKRDFFQQANHGRFSLLWQQIRQTIRGCLLLSFLLLAWTPNSITNVKAQTEDEPPVYLTQAEALLAQMSVEERVGQLFMVTFEGDAATRSSEIAELILSYRIGGVVLQANNDNITGYGELSDVPLQVAQLSNDLQRLAILGLTTAVSEPDPTIDEDAVPPTRAPVNLNTPIPLIIATSQEGDGAPTSQIFNGLTDVPNNMAIGATWQPSYAHQVGEIVAQELSALGVNMLIGPSLDVLENPDPFGGSDLGTRTFGGDPYWVGQMAQAYAAGIHSGSGRIAVVPKHFPGYGGSDRPLHEEVPTVQKSLEQLKQIELAPFFAVTNVETNQMAVADALLTTHIRYQGFQGNIRATTNPVSFDQQALATLMAQEEFVDWRNRGGILLSDALGVRAVKRFYDDSGETFPHRLVAKDAFLAGNDLLYLADFGLETGNNEQALANIKDTMEWFRERYQIDPAFQEKVDEAVLRILMLKLRLYEGDLSSQNVLIEPDEVTAVIQPHQNELIELAQTAVTLISPNIADLAEQIPQPPGNGDNIIIFTDVRTTQQCSFCPEQPLISKTAIEERMLTLYGPTSSEQVQPEQIESFSLSELQDFLDAGTTPIFLPDPLITETLPINENATPATAGATSTPTVPTLTPTPTPPPGYLVQESLKSVNWIVFGMLDASNNAQTLSDFLAQRPDLARDSHIIVFAYNAPYYLDSTEISQLTAFYGIYSKSIPFIDASVRTLFQELPIRGQSPVNIDGIRYDLFTQTQPNADQVIDLYIVDEDENEIEISESGESLDVSVGDTLDLKTGIILDNNNNPVPDGTLVRFIQRDRVQGLINIIDERPTTNGVAQLNYVLEARTEAGQFQITAESGNALISLEVNISVGTTDAQITIVTPVPPPTSTPLPSPTPTETPTSIPSATPRPTATAVPVIIPPEEPGLLITLPKIQMILALLIGLGIIGGISFLIGHRIQARPGHQLGLLLWGVVGALFVYNYLLLQLPGSSFLLSFGSWASLLSTLLGGIIGLAGYQLKHR